MGYILLVDDDEDLRGAIQNVLEEEGHAVVTARDGAQALEVLAHREPPRVALVDLYMPVMDGVELIAKMRDDPRLAGIPIIVLSAASSIQHPAGTTALAKVGMRAPLLQEIERLCGSRASVI